MTSDKVLGTSDKVITFIKKKAMRINYKSDFDFLVELEDAQGGAMGFPAWDFKLLVATPMSKPFVAECVGGECRGCYDDGGRIHVVCDGHGLLPGRVSVAMDSELPNAIYGDGRQRVFVPRVVDADIELVVGNGDESATASVELAMPVAVITAYDMAVAHGYAGTQEEYVAALHDLPFAVQQAYIEANNAGSRAAAANAAASNANAAANSAEMAAGNANGAADNANAEAQSARQAASDASQAADRANTAAADAATAAETANDKIQELGTALEDASEATSAATQAAERAEAAADIADMTAADAASKATLANQAASDASQAAERANTATSECETATGALNAVMPRLAVKDTNNNFTSSQTVNGTLTVNGDIVQSGNAYVVEAEHVKAKNAYVTLRDGAVGGLGADERAGIEVKAYDGDNDGVIELGADGVLRVGDKGDAQPVLTRAEASELNDGDLLVWDAASQRAVPMGVDIVDMEVTYEDDSVEVFKVICKRYGGE